MARMLLTKKRPGLRLFLGLVFLLFSAISFGQVNGTIRITVFPDVILADGVSPTIVTAEVRDQNGSLVPDGTTVLFETKLGTFDQGAVPTTSGVARATLHASSAPGTASIRVSVLRYNAFAQRDVQFVSDRRIITDALKPVEVEGSASLTYSVKDHIFEASGDKGGAVVKYTHCSIVAEELQYNINTATVIAHDATLTVNNVSRKFDELSFNLKQQTGLAFGNVAIPGYFATAGKIALYVPPKIREGYVDIDHDKVSLHDDPVPETQFQFAQVLASPSLVTSQRATVVKDSTIQFQHATLRVSGQAIMKQPYFELPLYVSSDAVTEQFVSVNNNQLAVNMPYYVGLNPNSTSLLRLRYSSPFEGGAGFDAGTYLDYEMNWNNGGAGQGQMMVGGIGRDDWGMSLHQSWMSSAGAVFTAGLDSPGHSSLSSSLGYTQPFKGSNLSVSYGNTHVFADSSSSNTLSALFEMEPKRLGKLPANFSWGFTANSESGSSFGSTAAGLEARVNSDTLNVGPLGQLRGSYRVAELYSGDNGIGTSQTASLGLTTEVSKGFTIDTGYQFSFDPFGFDYLGHHQLSVDSMLHKGPWMLRGSIERALDFDRLSTRVSLGRDISRLWRFDLFSSFDELLGESTGDTTFTLEYKLGVRALGLTYSQRSQRLGLQIGSVSF